MIATRPPRKGGLLIPRRLPPIAGATGPVISQTASALIQWGGASSSVTFGSAVASGDFLYIVFSAWNFGNSTAQPGFAASDNINGSWTVLDANEFIGGSVHVYSAFAYFANSASATAGTLKVTLAHTSGPSGVVCAVDAGGIATTTPVIAHGINSSASTAAITTPSETDTAAGDLVIGYAGVGFSPVISAGSGATLDVTLDSGGVGSAGIVHLTANSAVGGNSTHISLDSAQAVQAGTVLVAAAGGGGAAPSALPVPRLMSMGVGS